MAQDPEALLRSFQIPNGVKADAWDAYQESTNEDDLAERLKRLPMTDDMRATLWDLKYAAGSKQPTTATPPPAPAAEEPGWLESAAQLSNNLMKGAGKGVASTLLGAAKLTGAVPKDTTLEDLAVPFTGGQQMIGQPQGLPQNLGYYGEQVGEFFVPAAVAGKGAKGAQAVTAASKLPGVVKTGINVATRAGLEGAAGAGVTALQSGDTEAAKTAGVISAAIPVAGKILEPGAKLLKGFLSEKIAPRVVAQLIKPPKAQLTFAKDPAGEVARQGIVAGSIDSLKNKINAVRQNIGRQIDQRLSVQSVQRLRVDVAPLINGPVDAAIKKAKIDGNAALVSRLEAFRTGQFAERFGATGNVTRLELNPLDARKLKTDIGDSFRWSPDVIDGTLNDVKQEIYRGINNAIETAVPGTREMNKKYANLLAAEKSVQNRIDTVSKADFIGLSDKAAGTASAILTAVVHGSVPESIAVGLLTGGASKALRSTPGSTAIATLLGKLSPDEKTAIATKLVPLLRNLTLAEADKP